MKNDGWSRWLGWLVVAMVGCGTPAPDTWKDAEAALGETLSPAAAGKPAMQDRDAQSSSMFGPRISVIADALVWTNDGRLAIVSGKDGSARQVADVASAGNPREIAYDPWGKRAIVFEQDDEEQGGEITTYPLVPSPMGVQLGLRAHLAWVDGDLRLLPSSLGLVTFAQSYGTWWKLFFSGDGSVRSVAAPLPSSAWITPTAGGISIQALIVDEAQSLHRVNVFAASMLVEAPVSTSLGIASESDASTARLMPAPAHGDAMLFDVHEASLSIRLVNGVNAGPAVFVPLGVSGARIEHAVPLDGGEIALLLLSGPSRVLAVEVGTAGEALRVASLNLPGAVRRERTFFSRDLVPQSARRALVATSTGVYAIAVVRDALGVHLELDASFAGNALRGPIESLSEKPI